MRYAIINDKNIVVSVIVWAQGQFKTPRGHTVVQSDVAQPGSVYDAKQGKFFPVGTVLSKE